ncbi:NADH:ubiquinone oxidoreductase, NDUFS4/18 kDa subunit [Ceraceosorus bombacis]|uniref:NADH dehydrogenase [ubiquinone] iron-sulfur protein 4, mitochondrial n=1 Tax=Ceraceosorus bombacis TaxID=401625 RepID=A0A0P1BHP3_9BASI|nr:NADH:ubiquinone oxidoreductase, NDUFS4/18 kDa subunit [Ceraceosorus bombacis]
MSLIRHALTRASTASRALSSQSSCTAPTSFSTFAPLLESSSNSSVPAKKDQVRDLAAEQRARQSEPVAADVVSDAPTELRQRAVRIFKPTKTANSSGKAGTNVWRVDFDIMQGSGRWENPLMGWASTADYMQALYIKFKSKDDAIHFCEKQNWPYFVQEPHAPRIPPKSYAANYAYSDKKLRIHQTK